jgi:hypothetical protein
MFSIDWRVCCFFFVPPRSISRPAQSRVRAPRRRPGESDRLCSQRRLLSSARVAAGTLRAAAAAEKWSAMRTLGLAALVLVVLTLAACSPGAAGGAAGPGRPAPDSGDKPGGDGGGSGSM